MVTFGKHGTQSTLGWDVVGATQTLTVGRASQVGLSGGAPGGGVLEVRAVDPTVCTVHEQRRPPGGAWRDFSLLALKPGTTAVNASVAGAPTAHATMQVVVSGRADIRLVFYPGERFQSDTDVKGTIYVVGASGERFSAAGGPAVVKPDRGGHSAEPTPAGHYVLGRKEHVVTNGWPKSSIPYGAALRVAPNGEVEFRGDHGGWHWATGPAGKVTQAELGFYARDHHPVSLPEAMAKARGCFFNAVGTLISNVWTRNDFGLWGWNLQRHGKRTVFFVHTTPRDEDYTALGVAFALQNSHGCVHVFPRERDEMVAAGFLKEGVPFDVRPYSETGPP